MVIRFYTDFFKILCQAIFQSTSYGHRELWNLTLRMAYSKVSIILMFNNIYLD